MALVLGATLLMLSGNCVQAYSFSDYKNQTFSSCPGIFDCKQNAPEGKFCECGDDCAEKSTCCYDAPTYDKEVIKKSLRRSKCMFYRKFLFGCDEGWGRDVVQEMCDAASPYDFSRSQDPLLHLPVTSNETKITYPNYYCAICNRDAEHVVVWRYKLSCNSIPTVSRFLVEEGMLLHSALKTVLSFSDEEDWPDENSVEEYCSGEKWTDKKYSDKNCSDCNSGEAKTTQGHVIKAKELNITYSEGTWFSWMTSLMADGEVKDFGCSPELVQDFGEWCCQSPSTVDKCDSKWNDREVEDLCHSFKGQVVISFTKYRNVFCAICNYESVADPCKAFGDVCVSGTSFSPLEVNLNSSQNVDNYGPGISPLSILFNSSYISNKDLVSVCKDDEEFFPGYCTEGQNGFLCRLSGARYRKSVCVKRNQDQNCTYLVTKDSNADGTSTLGWVTLALILVSIVCLLLHLIISVTMKELSNLPGKNLASLCLALLLSYITFLAANFFERKSDGCYATASLMYFSWIASFCWMSVIAFDTWWSFEKALREFRRTQGSRWLQFLFYSVFSWLTSTIFLIVVILIDHFPPEGIDQSFIPKLGQNGCWFGENNSLQVFFVYPVIVFIGIIALMFVRTAWIISKTTDKSGRVTDHSARKRLFKAYSRLAILTGLSWLTFILSRYIRAEFLDYLFVILNCLQGTFIFLAFSCKRKILTGLREKGSSFFSSGRTSETQTTTVTPATSVTHM